MDLQTFCTIILSSTFAVGVAVVLYAMSIVKIDPPLARMGAFLAWVSIILIFALFGGTNDMERWLRYGIAAILAAIATIILCISLEYIKHREGDVKNSASITSIPAASRIVLTKFVLTPIDASNPASDFGWQLFFINKGSIPGYAPQLTLATRISDVIIPDNEIDRMMNESLRTALTKQPDKTQQVEVNQEYIFPTNDLRVRPEDFNAIKNGTKRLYVILIMKFTDDSLSPDSFWISEFCGTQSGDLSSIQICRQKTYLQKNS
jgi:hypothetical protein